MRNRASQKETIFYVLYKRFKAKEEKSLPVFELMGERYIEELQKWGYVSYECSARCSEMMKENPGLFYREWIVGRSGAKFYGYRLSKNASEELIKDPQLLEFYRRVRARMPGAKPRPVSDAQAMDEWWKNI